jgi:hypothetical protein
VHSEDNYMIVLYACKPCYIWAEIQSTTCKTSLHKFIYKQDNYKFFVLL